MGSFKQPAGVITYDRSALEYIYMKPWRKSFISTEFLNTPVLNVERAEAESSQISDSHSIFSIGNQRADHSNQYFSQRPHREGYSLPVRCPNGVLENQSGFRASGDTEEEEDEANFRLQEPGFWVTDEILDEEMHDESSTESETILSSEEEDEEQSIDNFAIEYAPELQLPSNVTVVKLENTGNVKKIPTRGDVLLELENTLTEKKLTDQHDKKSLHFMSEEVLRFILDSEEYVCPECLMVFPRATTLAKHKMLMHDVRRPFVCTICEKRFTDANNLKVHKYTMHGAGKHKKKKYGARHIFSTTENEKSSASLDNF